MSQSSFRGRGLLLACFGVIAAETVFAVPYYAIYLVLHRPITAAVAGSMTLAVAATVAMRHSSAAKNVANTTVALIAKTRLWHWLVVGLAGRIFWAVLLPAPLRSDALLYFQFASALTSGKTWQWAFYPPGYPLFLTPFFAVFGKHEWVTTVAALTTFVMTTLLASQLAKRLSGATAAALTAAFLALWPGNVTMVGIGYKEPLLALLVTAAVGSHFYSQDATGHKRWLLFTLSGLLTGAAALTQPGFLLFPSVFLAIEFLYGGISLKQVSRTLVVTLAMAAAVAPWTIRNYFVHHRFVLISTNGGNVFYRANNPRANGGFSADGEIALPENEFEADKQGYKEGLKWMAHNPGAEFVLMLRKQMNYLGDDSDGSYETLRRGLDLPLKWHAIVKSISNGFWLVLWCLILLLLPILRRALTARVEVAYLLVPIVYQFCIDTVFESGGRHHVPYSPLIAVLVAIIITTVTNRHDLTLTATAGH